MKSQPKHIVIVAGEESGDAHAAELVHQLRQWDTELTFTGVGGQHMENAGVQLVSDLARHAVTGLTEVLRSLPMIRKGFNQLKAHLINNPPDLLILVDYPSFNLRLAKFAKKTLGLKIIYYISPQIWAWKANRIHLIKKCVDHMAVILPFEKKLYQQANVPVSFVGHPLLKKLPSYLDTEALRTNLNIPAAKHIVALLPGSRRNEIQYHMPVMAETITKLSKEANFHFIIPVAKTLPLSLIQDHLDASINNVTILHGQAIEAIAASDCVVVASGTASLETALLAKPMCIVYKGALLSYILAMKLIRVRYFGLCNLLVNKMLAPELLQYDFNTQELSKMILFLLHDTNYSRNMVQGLKNLKESLSADAADQTLLELVQEVLSIK